METASKLDNALLEQARSLVSEPEAGNTRAAESLIDEFARQRDQSLYREPGKMTRQLHDALNGFPLNARIQTLAETEFSDARLRLNHVIIMTEDSVNRTLNAVEDKRLMHGTGPQVPGIKATNDAVSGQDEVDDLLSSLGF